LRPINTQMKVANILSALALLGVGILAYLHFNGNTKKAGKTPRVIVTKDSTTGNETEIIAQGGNIAYVDLDTLEANYSYFKKKKTEFENRDKALGAELERTAADIQNEAAGLQERARNGQLTEAEGMAAEKRLYQRQQDLEKRRQNQGTALLDDQEKFNKDLQDNIRGFLDGYAEEKGYDLILAYTATSTILYVNEEMDITKEVTDALNSGKSFKKKDKKKEEDVKDEAKAETKEATKK
jgi:outer membrane protein